MSIINSALQLQDFVVFIVSKQVTFIYADKNPKSVLLLLTIVIHPFVCLAFMECKSRYFGTGGVRTDTWGAKLDCGCNSHIHVWTWLLQTVLTRYTSGHRDAQVAVDRSRLLCTPLPLEFWHAAH